MATVSDDSSGSVATLGANGAKARYGVAYVRAVCSQAGVRFTEPSPDEDVVAVDGTIGFYDADVRVQIKCTGQFRINGGETATWKAEPHWRESWRRSRVPVYFVLVIVDPDDQPQWLYHQTDGTFHRAAAFWVRVDGTSEGAGITVPKKQRLTVDTFREWATDLEACFTPASLDDGDHNAH